MLTDLDYKLLYEVYQLNFNYGERPNVLKLGFENNQHVAYHLLKLNNTGHLNFYENKVFNNGGRRHEKYKNNVVVILWDDIKITSKGIDALKEKGLI